MFFKSHFNSIADILDSKFRSYEKIAKNPSDKGELCELFIKEFLIDALSDSFKIFRGGRVIDWKGNESKQLDVVLTGKRTIKIFGDKGIYPVETVYGCMSITATLSKAKLMSCCSEFASIPKANCHFTAEQYIPDKKRLLESWQVLAPYKCVFAYQGELKAEWIQDILDFANEFPVPYNIVPDLIIVNKCGMIEKKPNNTTEWKPEFNFVPFEKFPYYGAPFAKVLYDLNTFNWEELYLKPELSYYLNQDLDASEPS